MQTHFALQICEMPLHLSVPESPSAANRNAVLAPLIAYNDSRVGSSPMQLVSVMLTDDNGCDVGGLWARCSYDWLFIELLVVPEQHRKEGYGSKLMAQAEEIATNNNCVGIWLDTFEFQARGFYEKLGFEVFGELPDHPKGQKRFFLRKFLRQE